MNYTEVKTNALAYADRADNTEILANIDLFIRIVEAKINRKLTTQKMSGVATIPIVDSQDFYTLPADFLSQRSVDVLSSTGTRKTLTYINPEQLVAAQTNASKAGYYLITAGSIQLYPVPASDSFLEITYYSRLVPLTPLAPDNWLATYNPDCYIFGLLVEINAFVKDAAAATMWDVRFKESLDDIDFQDAKSTWSGTALTTKVG